MSLLSVPPASRSLGAGAIPVSPMAWGMWRLADGGRSAAEAAALVHAALDAGITLFDTADIYGFDGAGGFGDAEALLGEVLVAELGLRDGMVIATKGGIRPPLPYDQSAGYLGEAIDNSLRRLRIDAIDLWQIHRPDILTHPQEVARALDDAVAAGKVREIGVSNFTMPQVEALASFMGRPLAATQPEISPLRIDCFESGELDQAMRMNLIPLAWSPLGGGRLLAPGNERERRIADELDRIGREQGVGRAVVAYGWLMAHPAGIIPIVGSQSAARIGEAVQAVAMRWTRQDWYAVFVAARGERLP